MAIDSHFYLIGSLTGDNWNSNQTSHKIGNVYNGKDGKFYIEVDVTVGKAYYFALYNGSYQYRPDTDQKAPNSDGNYNSTDNSWKYTPTTNKIWVCIDETSQDDQYYPWVWVEEKGSSETKFTVNVYASTGGTVSTSSVSVGSTPVSITATPNADYIFKQWIATGGVNVENPTSATTTITATAAGAVTANFEYSSTPTPPTPTPSNTNYAYYLIGNLMDTDNTINTTDRKFRFFQNTDGTYYFDVPATLTVNTQIVAVAPNGTSKIYGPASGNQTFGISDNTSATYSLANNSSYFTANDRGLVSSGIYSYTLTVAANGNPTSVTVSHDKTRLVAYYWPEATTTNPNPTAQPTYTVRKSDGGSDNRYFGNVNLEDGQHCWVISNITKNADNNTIGSPLVTVTKLYKQGNGGGNVITRKADDGSNAPDGVDYTHVYPYYIHQSNKSDEYKANLPGDGFTFGGAAAYTLEYNPSKGTDEVTKVSENKLIGGEILEVGFGELAAVINSINIIGTGIPASNSWDISTKQPMTYNQELQCYEYTFTKTTPESESETFRFVANDDWTMNWEENSTDAADKARVPYTGSGAGHSALESDPNYIKKAGADNGNRADAGTHDIILNRPAGEWTIRFYIKTTPTSSGNNYTVDYYYTITGTESFDIPLTLCNGKFIRTYSNDVPMDLKGNVKAYIAYKFEQPQNPEDNYAACKVYLRQMEYIPANVGVVLIGQVPGSGSYSEGDKLNFSLTKRVDEVPEDLCKVWVKYESYTNDAWHNFLVPTVTAVNNLGNAKTNDDGKVIERYFGLGNYHSTAYYKQAGGDDYIGFFRLTEKGKSGANKAYLSIPSSENTDVLDDDKDLYGVLDFNAQLSGQQTDEDGTPSLAKAMLLFDDEDFDDAISTSISSVNVNAAKDNNCYTLQGIKVMNPTKGLYIKNGKKYIFK